MVKKKVENIPNDDYLYRRLPPAWYVAEENRVSSAAFRGRDDASVYWEKHTTS